MPTVLPADLIAAYGNRLTDGRWQLALVVSVHATLAAETVPGIMTQDG